MVDGKSLRIVHCLRAPVGGVFRHVEDLVRHQAAAGHAVGLVCAADLSTGHEAQRLQALATHLELGLHRVPMGRSIGPGDAIAFVLVRGTLQITRQRAGEPASYCLHATPRAPLIILNPGTYTIVAERSAFGLRGTRRRR